MERTRVVRDQVRGLMPVEGDLAFRRRCETIVEWLDSGADDVVLDCGCGYGYVTRILALTSEAKIVALDPDANRLVAIDSDRSMRGRVQTIVGDAQGLPFEDNAFTRVVCSEVLEHLDDDGAAMSELFRVLIPGGIAVITIPSRSYPWSWDPINGTLKRMGGRQLRGERPWSGIWYGHKRLYSS
jgi:ubiquinone/menaquinone biosynthesis C-methylase UbiE